MGFYRNGLLYEIDLATTVCTRKLKGHSTSINKVQAGSSKIVTVSDDQTVCVWYKSGAVSTEVIIIHTLVHTHIHNIACTTAK